MEPAERVALGMVDAERKRRQNVVGAEILEIDGLVLAFSNVPDPQLNSIVVEHEPLDPVGSLVAAEREFVRRDQAIGIELQMDRNPGLEAAVHSVGLTRIIERPAMATAPSLMPPTSMPDGIDVHQVASDEDVRGLVEVGVQAFGDDPDIGMAFYGASSRGVDGARSFVAWDGERPVGISAGYHREGAVGVMGVAVVPGARGRGLGSALTVLAARAFPGADLAWLYPSDEARSMYERLGFRRVADDEIWVREVSQTAPSVMSRPSNG
jgi:ribosomal protein S18 acetylase RimI-like enzyme